ncbi:hypothetical protein WICPIJ_008164 [Wickerhamomyces pijperi]|uniref:Uncharacterized protein n=1 Tax=Wickerhamomyces pijperi TaxID=599730 RepID=A0A9P8PZZ8_WICPI|nr:hypothetical protein WICPIJ_008164 [Wickerhamomyces pijperi]
MDNALKPVRSNQIPICDFFNSVNGPNPVRVAMSDDVEAKGITSIGVQWTQRSGFNACIEVSSRHTSKDREERLWTF